MDSKMLLFSSLDSSSILSSGSFSATTSFLMVPLGEVMQLMPSFQFSPMNEELVLFFLERKMCMLTMKIEIIHTIGIYKWNPKDFLAISLLKTRDKQWFFLTHIDRKYYHGSRFSCNIGYGFWTLARNECNGMNDSLEVGMKNMLVFHKGKAQADWVMHEYTSIEEKLERCQDDVVQGHYSLCKVLKKNGYDLRKGEQYGAPFRKEDWVDNDLMGLNVNSSAFQLQLKEVVYDGRVLANVPLPSSFNGVDFGEVHSTIRGPIPWLMPFHVPNLQVEAYFMRPEIVAEDPQGVVVEQFTEGVNDLEALFEILIPDDAQEDGLQPSFIHIPNINMGELHAEDEFLEHDDLIDLDLAFPNIENPMENMEFVYEPAIDALLDPILDAEMLVHDMWPEQETFDHSYVNSPQSDAGNEDYQLLPNEDDANQIDGELWMHDEGNILNLTQDNDSSALPTPGMVSESTTEGSENHNSIVGGDAASSLSSLWTYVEPIPSTPRSTFENA